MNMHLGVFHTLFDLAMGAVLLHWVGRKLADLSRHDTVSVVWECMMSEVRRLRARPEPERAPELTHPAQSYR
jgi:hypothetical protein